MDKIKRFILITLKSISQVIFVENSLAGLIMLTSITIFDYQLGLITFLSGLIGSLVASLSGGDKNDIDQGLYGFNSVLIGMALFIFIESPISWIIAPLAAGFGGIYYGSMKHILKNTGLPVLTFPFITTTWVILLASYGLGSFQLMPDLIPGNLSNIVIEAGTRVNYIKAIVNGIGQVYFQSSIWAGLLILFGVFLDSRKMGVYTIIGGLAGFITAYILKVQPNSINLGLYGYNAVLTAITIYSYEDSGNKFKPISGIIGAMATVPLMAGLNTLFIPYGIPSLTISFVLVSWIFIGAKKILTKL